MSLRNAIIVLLLLTVGICAQTPTPTPRRAYIPGSRVPTTTVVMVIPTGTPMATTPGTEGQVMQDNNYLYTFLAGSWKKTPRLNL